MKTPLQAEPRTPFRRRRGIDAPIVAAQAIAQSHIDFLQFHRRQRRLLINPAQAPTVHKYFGLTPKPVGQGRGLCLSHQQTGNAQLSIAVARNLYQGAVYVHPIKRQGQKRSGRERNQHARQAQHFFVRGISQHKVGDFQGGQPVGGEGIKVAYADLDTQGLRSRIFDVDLPIEHTWHDPKMQGKRGHSHQAPRRQGQPPQHPNTPSVAAPPARGLGGDNGQI